MKECSTGCNEYNSLSRREFMKNSAKAALLLSLPAWMPRVSLAQNPGVKRDVIISLFLRGGADGLSICVPFGDPYYYQLRPTLAIPRPDSTSPYKATALDQYFGISKGLTPLLNAYKNGNVAFVQATGGSPNNWTRSHFDAMKWMETGKPDDITLFTGWLARHLQTTGSRTPGARLRGVGLEYGLAQTLTGAPQTMPVPDPSSFGYAGAYSIQAEMSAWLQKSYSRAPDPLKSAAIETQATIDLFQRIDFVNYQPTGNAKYPDSDLGRALRATAALLKAEAGVEAITIDAGGWDTHSQQGAVQGYMFQLLADLGSALAAFHLDMFSANKTQWVLVAMSEFGRNAIENDSQGTDHGTANTMIVMGGGINGGKVYGKWPGLGPGQLFEDQDLMITTDYRDVLGEIVTKRLGNTQLGVVFPDYTPKLLGIAK